MLYKCHFHCVGWTQQVFNRLFDLNSPSLPNGKALHVLR